MLRTLIEKEIRDLIGSTKFAITFGACAFLILASFYAGAARYKMHQSQYEASQSENLRQLEGNTDWASVGEAHAFLPPQPLGALVSGISNDIGRTAVVRGRGEPITQDSRYNEDPIYAVFRFLDLEFIFKVILSLFAILLGYDAISGEKERGTLRLSLANAVPRHTYILGKLAGGTAVLAVSLLIAIGMGTLLLPLMGVSLSGEEWVRLSLIVLSGLLYFGVFLTMSVFVSAMTQRSSNSFMVLLVIWIVSVLIIPKVSVLLAGRGMDVPSVDQIAAQKASYSAELRNDYLDGISNAAIDLSDAGDDPMKPLMAFMDSLTNVSDEKMQVFSSRLNEERHNRQLAQSRAAFSLARISPTASLTLAISQLARTSLSLKESFYREAMAYSETFGEFKYEKTGQNSGVTMRIVRVGEDQEEPERIDPGEMPTFNYTQSELADAVNASVVDFGVLALFNLLFFAGAFVAFTRYDVR